MSHFFKVKTKKIIDSKFLSMLMIFSILLISLNILLIVKTDPVQAPKNHTSHHDGMNMSIEECQQICATINDTGSSYLIDELSNLSFLVLPDISLFLELLDIYYPQLNITPFRPPINLS